MSDNRADGSSPEASNEETNQSVHEQKQVSLGPACLVFVIFGLIGMSVFMVAISWIMMGKESEMAAKAIETLLIPWVEESLLEKTDKDAILEELNGLLVDIKDEKLNERQLLRLKLRITETPILQWGVVQQVLDRISKSELTDKEKQTAMEEGDRLMRGVAEGKITMQQLGFMCQKVASQERKTGRLQILPETELSDLREFIRRAASICDTIKIPREPYPSTPRQVFHRLIVEALTIPKD